MQPTDLEKLLKSFPEPNADAFQRRIDRLNKVKRFYEDRIDQMKKEGAKEDDKRVGFFMGLASAAGYAIHTMRSYQALTKRLHALADGQQVNSYDALGADSPKLVGEAGDDEAE